MNKIIYRIMQGVITDSEEGNYWMCGEFTNIREARQKFEEVKKDLTGIKLEKNEHLETMLEDNYWDDEEEHYEPINCIAYFEYRG